MSTYMDILMLYYNGKATMRVDCRDYVLCFRGVDYFTENTLLFNVILN
jgi:hypothetical protein